MGRTTKIDYATYDAELDQWSCKSCGYSSNKMGIYNHHRIHIKSHKCEICDPERRFSTKKDLRRHVDVYHSATTPGKTIEKHHCTKCDKVFSRADNLTRHNKEFHDGQTRHRSRGY